MFIGIIQDSLRTAADVSFARLPYQIGIAIEPSIREKNVTEKGPSTAPEGHQPLIKARQIIRL